MKQYFLAVCLMFAAVVRLSGQVQAQYFPLIDSVYTSWQQFRLESITKIAPCDTFLYADLLLPEMYDMIKDYYSENKLVISRKRNPYLKTDDSSNIETIEIHRAELDSMLTLFEFTRQLPWPDTLFGPKSKVLAANSVIPFLNGIEAYSKYERYEQVVCYGVKFFSRPIVFRNNTLCMFIFGSCNVLDGFVQFTLYRKENNEWKIMGTLAVWDR